MWECIWKLNATSAHCTSFGPNFYTWEIITFFPKLSLHSAEQRGKHKGTKKYRLKNLIKEQHKRELKIRGNYCQRDLL